MTDFIAKNARLYPDRIAFVEVRPISGLRRDIKWGPFSARIARLANALMDKGVGKGDRVFILGKNSIHWLEAYFAVMETGALAVPLNYRFSDENILYCAKVSEPVAFFMDEEYAARMGGIRSRLPTIKHFISIGEAGPQGMEKMEDLIENASSIPPHVEIEEEDECALYFTSGTTGEPKPVLLMHKNLVCSGICEALNEHWEPADTMLMLPPFYHLAIGHLLGCIIAGGRAVLLTEKITPDLIFENMSEEKVSLVFLLVPWVLDILGALDAGTLKKQDFDLDRWRLLFLGAQPIPPSLVERWKQYFPEMQINITYGLSEAGGPGAIHLGNGNEQKSAAIGKPALLWDARIVNENGEDVPKGEVGEIILKGSGVMKAYYKNPGLTAKTIRNGWLYTGDLGREDEEGFIYLVDRKKDLVIRGGENIFPVEIEEVILRHPLVRDVAVIGIPDERLGETVAAVIEATSDQGPSRGEMALFCEKNLPRYKRPSHIIFDKVPRSPTGKIEKPKLRAKYCK
jgi:acyl-CoA synthetase (AMP-forming)/AMP-acid ligase II